MTNTLMVLAIAFCSTACGKPGAPTSFATAVASVPSSPSSSPITTHDAVQQKLRDYSGTAATDCGRLDTHAVEAQSKAAADCALQSNQNKRPFYVAYDMPGMTIGVAGNADGKLFSVQSQGTGSSAALSTGNCPSQLRLAASGRVTCFAPGDMGAMGAGHTAIPPGMPNPHAFPKAR